jgi:hypothetical protein
VAVHYWGASPSATYSTYGPVAYWVLLNLCMPLAVLANGTIICDDQGSPTTKVQLDDFEAHLEAVESGWVLTGATFEVEWPQFHDGTTTSSSASPLRIKVGTSVSARLR